ncbi:MAG: 6-bladed beta-propeller [bacterium]
MEYFYRKIYLIIILLFTLLSFLGCDNHTTSVDQNKQQLFFDVSNWELNKLIPEEVIANVEFVPLETDENFLIGQVNKILVYNDIFYVLDKSSKQIFVFDMSGKFIQKIGVYGRGPGEYIRLNDFIVDTSRNRILTLDSYQRKILMYDLTDGKSLGEIKLDFWATNFTMVGNNTLFFFMKNTYFQNYENYSLVSLNLKDLSKKEYFLEIDEYNVTLSYHYSMYKSNNVYYCPYLKDVVYEIEEDGVIPAVKFNFGDHKISEEKLKSFRLNNGKNLTQVLFDNDCTYGIKNFLESDNFLSFKIKIQNKSTLVVYCKETGNYHYGSAFEGVLNGFRSVETVALTNQKFIGFIDSYSFIRMQKRINIEPHTQIVKNYNKILKRVSSNSNPVIILIEYNQF